MFSNQPTSCAPSPLCKSGTYTFDDPSRLVNASLYEGNATAHDWTIDQGKVLYPTAQQPGLALLLTEANGGTRISSTRYIMYGQVTVRMKTSHYNGVVAAAILMSNIKDEIDWEAPGNSTTSIQNNVYILGIAAYDNGGVASGLNDTFTGFHDYTVNWSQNNLEWLIDGKVVRSINDTAGGQGLPASPSRIQISIWPAGINASAKGTVEWAGGYIDWNNPDYVAAGDFYSIVESVTVNCSALPETAPPNAESYVYGPNATRGPISAPVVLITNQSTIDGALSLNAISAWTFWTGLLLGTITMVF